jgi:hypothetical protein
MGRSNVVPRRDGSESDELVGAERAVAARAATSVWPRYSTGSICDEEPSATGDALVFVALNPRMHDPSSAAAAMERLVTIVPPPVPRLPVTKTVVPRLQGRGMGRLPQAVDAS